MLLWLLLLLVLLLLVVVMVVVLWAVPNPDAKSSAVKRLTVATARRDRTPGKPHSWRNTLFVLAPGGIWPVTSRQPDRCSPFLQPESKLTGYFEVLAPVREVRAGVVWEARGAGASVRKGSSSRACGRQERANKGACSRYDHGVCVTSVAADPLAGTTALTTGRQCGQSKNSRVGDAST